MGMALHFVTCVFVAILLALPVLSEPEEELKQIQNVDAVAAEQVKIPRIMHHIYWRWDKSGSETDERQEKWAKCRNTCIEKTPGYEYKLWDDVMIERLITTHYHWLMPMYKSYDYEVQRSDVARYLILHHVGGIYLDMDDCCRVSMEPLIQSMEHNGESVLLPRALPFGTGNDILVSTKGNDFMAYAIYHLLCTNKWYIIPYTTVLMSTGTLFLNARRQEYKKMFPEFNPRLLGVEERAQTYLFREGGSTWHRIDGDIIFHVYSYYKFYTSLAVFVLCLMCILRLRKCRRPLRFLQRKVVKKVSYA